MSETTPLIKAALNLRVGAGFDVYHKKAFCFGDVVKIYTRILYFNGVKIHFEYKFYSDSKDGIYALAETRHGFVDKELHPIMLQSVLRSEYDNIIGYMNAIE